MKKSTWFVVPLVLVGFIAGCTPNDDQNSDDTSTSTSSQDPDTKGTLQDAEQFAAAYNQTMSVVYSTQIDREALQDVYDNPSEGSFQSLEGVLSPLIEKYDTTGLDDVTRQAFLVLLGNTVLGFPGAEGEDLQGLLSNMTVDPETVVIKDGKGVGQVGAPRPEGEEQMMVQLENVDGSWLLSASDFVKEVTEASNTDAQTQVDIFLYGMGGEDEPVVDGSNSGNEEPLPGEPASD